MRYRFVLLDGFLQPLDVSLGLLLPGADTDAIQRSLPLDFIQGEAQAELMLAVKAGVDVLLE